MAGGNDNQRSGAGPSEIWSPYSDFPTACLQTPNNIPATNIGGEVPMEVENYDDVFNVLSDIDDLQYSAPPPPPPPLMMASTNIPRLIERGEPSGANRNSDNLISHTTTPPNDRSGAGPSEIWSPYSDFPTACLQTPNNIPATNIGGEVPMEVENYDDVFNVLSDIDDLQYSAPPPPPPPLTMTSTNIPRLMERGESSEANRNSDNPISHTTPDPNNEVINSREEREREQKRSADLRQPQPRSARSSEAHNLSERRRRSRIQEGLKALQQLIPNSNKTDKASMLHEAIRYIKSLQHQLELMKSMGVPVMPQFPVAGHHRMQVPCFPPSIPMRPPTMGMFCGMGAYGSPYNSAGFHAFPNFGIQPSLPLSTAIAAIPPVAESRLLPVAPRQHYLTFPLHQSNPAAATLTSTTSTAAMTMTSAAQVIPGTAAAHNIYQTPGTNQFQRPMRGSVPIVQATQVVRSLGNAYAGALWQLINEDNEAGKTDQP